MILVQISDLHVTRPATLLQGVVDTGAHLRQVIAAICHLDPQPDCLVITGDLVENGRPDEYAELRDILSAYAAPLYVIPGNHDEREAFRAAFADQPWMPRRGPVQYTIEAHPLRLVALDTVVPGAPHGELDESCLIWLEDRLAEQPQRPTGVLVHHPPFDTGIAHMDAMGLLQGRDALAAVIRRHAQVQAILCGHVHRPIETRFAGTLAAICPSPAHQISLDLSAGGPAAFVMEPGGYRLWRWDGATLVAHTGVVGKFAGPYTYE